MIKSLIQNFDKKEASIAVVGLGYVGLPLALALSKKFKVIGWDINSERVDQLTKGFDKNDEHSKNELTSSNITFANDPEILKEASLIIAAVPTPVDEFNKPDLTPLEKVCTTIGTNLKKGAVVVFESTVYPGVTEEVCVSVLAKVSGLTWKKDFYVGYSPERVNPGDTEHTIEKIVKVVAGDTAETLELLAHVYGGAIPAGIHRASSIKVAEAAKVIENTQRDINIALINELSMIFDRIGIDSLDVLAAARTKWNFLNFRPGLVGGHCIGVDPFYLTHLAERVGINPQVILSGRRINNGMAKFIAEKTVKLIAKSPNFQPCQMKVGVLGLSFKENVNDLRNTKVVDVIAELEAYGVNVLTYDPVALEKDFSHEYNRKMDPLSSFEGCHAVVYAVPHKKMIEEIPLKRLTSMLANTRILVDVKGVFDREEASKHNLTVWRP